MGAHDVETFLEKPLESIPKDTVVVELGETKGLVELSLREGGLFDSHGHDDHDDHDKHDKHDDHAKHDDMISMTTMTSMTSMMTMT